MKSTRPTHGALRRAVRLASLLGLAAWMSSADASGQVPGQMNFQGLLLDSSGEPLNGSVTLVFALHADATGGTALWTETHPGVPVTDGIYDVALGSLTPLTPELFSSAERYLEISVDGELLAPRRQLLVVPYAIRSEVASTALNVGGVPADFVAQVYQHSDFDGNGIPNSDPTEGLADVDGDGAANFIDPDNDGDGLSDKVELAQGSDPNLVTPTITGFQPPNLPEQAPATVTVTGTNFDAAGLAVAFGSETPTPTNVTPTSFEVALGPQPAGSLTVVVSLANGEAAQAPFAFSISGRITVFVTSTTYNGLFPLNEGADARCQERASAAGLPGSYRAWIRGGGDPSRIADQWPPGSPFALVNDVVFAWSYDALVNSTTHTPRLDLDEFGGTQTGEVWTGGGAKSAGATCNVWRDNTSSLMGTKGGLGGSANWQNSGTATCDQLLHLYCFEQ